MFSLDNDLEHQLEIDINPPFIDDLPIKAPFSRDFPLPHEGFSS
jgi:hypothetical protein